MTISIAIIDIIGLTYDGTTLEKRGLGGSESAVILMSRELVKLGFNVTVFNNCKDTQAAPGIYDGVEYIDISTLDQNQNYNFDIIISSRTVIPFLPPDIWVNYQDLRPYRYELINRRAKYRVVWMHDTFCRGDELLEHLVVNKHVDELFTLSDFHTSYVTNCNHGQRRMFEVLKKHVFQTRNGIVKHLTEVDISAKDPHLYVYNASVTKGMLPLVEQMWGEIRQRLPRAKLKVIGGYYRFRENGNPDAQEKKWRELVADSKYQAMGVEFTGIITQKEIANILSQASYMIYPGAFPETFGISSLESLAYNTPLITTRFGALEETAIEQACYLLDYPIEPNSLFPHINAEQQQENFINLVLRAHNDRYLHQQKTYACNLVKDICEWSTVALQWKQHFFKKLGLYLSVDEYRKVSKINSRVHEVFGRRYLNTEENYIPRNEQQRIVVVTPMYNAAKYIEQAIESVATQDYDNWRMYIIDDASTDNSYEVAEAAINDPRITLIKNAKNTGAVYNQVSTIRKYTTAEDIVMLLDGDDSLVNNNQIFHKYNNLYHDSAEFTYGSCWSMIDSIPLVAQPYPESVKQSKSYRNHLFNWNMPYTHLRTFKAKLLADSDEDFLDAAGNWYKAGGDGSLFYHLIERADPKGVRVVSDIMYNYNDTNPLNDYKVNGDEQTRNATAILRKNDSEGKFSVIIPTMWRAPDIFEKSLTAIVAHPLVREVIIVDNDRAASLAWPILDNKKITIYDFEKNIRVNPAWNFGVASAKSDLICLANDDIVFDTRIFDKLADRVTPDTGVWGLITGEAHFNHPPTTDGSIDFVEWRPGNNIHGFGQLMFLHKSNWVPIIEGLEIYFGDDYIFHTQLVHHRKNYVIYNTKFESPMAATTKDAKLVEGFYQREQPIFHKWYEQNPISATKVNNNIPMNKPKTILIAVPTNKYIEPDTFKSIYNLIVPDGYVTEFQYFFGYQIDQIRNLIAEWAKQYDYLFSVDSDIVLPNDSLVKMLAHNVDIVSGLYIQRKPGNHILEIYRQGINVPVEDLSLGLEEIDACGFGCALIKGDVFRALDYPHFFYKSAIDHRNTISEDVYFCSKAKQYGFRVWADTTITCEHIGSIKFTVNPITKTTPKTLDKKLDRLIELGNSRLLPQSHVNYLNYLKSQGVEPKVIYDIGACVLHWTNEAARVWPNSKFVAFEAMPEVEPIYINRGIDYHIGLLSHQSGNIVKFYQNTEHPGGNSYYLENEQINPEARQYFNESHAVYYVSQSLDHVVKGRSLPVPDLIKMDVQGAELDVLRGAVDTLKSCQHLILELQCVEYNKGAPLVQEVVDYVTSLGFELVTPTPFSNNGPDGDYYFRRI